MCFGFSIRSLPLWRNIVRLEVLYGSQEYKFFTEVFAVSKVPCVCVIRESKVVEVINEGAGNDEFISRISGALNVQVDTDKSSIESSGTSDNEPMRRNSSDGTEERRKYQADLLKQRKQQQDERKRILELLEKDKQERRFCETIFTTRSIIIRDFSQTSFFFVK